MFWSCFFFQDDHGFCVREMSAESLQDVRISLPCIVLCQVALVDALSAASVFPMAVLGHSTGEIASAYAHGLTQLDDIVRAVYGRALGQHMMPDGLMMALFCSEADFNAVHESLTHKDRVYISARNAPRALTLSGSPEGIQEAFAACSKAGLKSIIVPHIQRAYHSPDTYCMRDSFLADMNQLKLPQQSWRIGRQPIVPEFISSVTGRRMPTPELDVQYWWQNVCCPVEFVAGCQELAKMEPAVVVEIGSHAVLQRFVNDTFAVPFLATQSSRSPNALTDFTRALLTLQSEHRVAVDWSVLHFKSSSTDDKSDWSACPLPWIEGSFRSAAWKCGPPIPSKTSSASSASVHSEASSSSRRSLTSASHLDAPVQRSQPRVAVPASRAVASKSVAPVSVSSKSEALDVGFVIDHQIRGNAICPGSLFAGEAIRSAPTTSSATVTVAQLEWRQTVSHPWNGVEAKASTGVTGTNGAIAYNLADDAMRFQRPAAATSAPAPLQFAGQWVDTASMSTAYASLREWCKIEFGPRFRLLKTIRSDSARCWLLASGTWRDHNDGENRWSVCLPTVLDAAFQACGMLVPLSNLAWVCWHFVFIHCMLHSSLIFLP
jgi:acyl transferase domain-containing protein